MRRFLSLILLLSLVISPCWSQIMTDSSQESEILKQAMLKALEELAMLNKLVPKLQESLRLAEQKLLDLQKSGTTQDVSLQTLEASLERALIRQTALQDIVAALKKSLEERSISMSDLKVEIQRMKSDHVDEMLRIIGEFERKVKVRNTIIVVESILLLIVSAILMGLVLSN